MGRLTPLHGLLGVELLGRAGLALEQALPLVAAEELAELLVAVAFFALEGAAGVAPEHGEAADEDWGRVMRKRSLASM